MRSDNPVRVLSWRPENRLHDRLRRLGAKRGYNAAYTAVGRELCGYIWTVATWLRGTLTTEAASVSHAEEVGAHP